MKTVVRKLPLRTRWEDPSSARNYMVEIDADLEAIAKSLGTKALGNKSKKTRALGGDIEVRVYRCKEED